MFSPETSYLVHQEQHKDRLREIEHQQLLQAAGLQGVSLKSSRKAVSWLGTQMVKWGSKLQGYDVTPSTKHMAVEIRQQKSI